MTVRPTDQPPDGQKCSYVTLPKKVLTTCVRDLVQVESVESVGEDGQAGRYLTDNNNHH